MFTCKNCRKKVPTINAKNQLCVDCDRARKRGKVEEPSPMIGKVEEPKKAEDIPKGVVEVDEKKEEESVEKQKKDNEEGEAKTEAKWP